VQPRSLSIHFSLRRLKALPAEKRSPVAAEGYWNVSEPTVQARAALEKKIPCSFNETPLRDVVTDVSKQAGVPIEIDMRAIEDAQILLDTPVSFKAGPLPPATLLDRMLGQIDLTYVIAADSLVVTTRERESERFSTAVYPVNRLISAAPRGRSLGALASLLQASVMSESWDSLGGSATIQPIDGDIPCLVIRQTTAGHRAVDAFLQALR
jgi:type II secretory pathway component GspD/PulD (secretin)